MNFLKNIISAFIGCCIALLAAGMLAMGFLGAMLAFGNTSNTVIPTKGILKLDFSSPISERTAEASALEMIQGSYTSTISILDAVKAIEAAATDPAISFIYMTPDDFAGSISHAEELRNALERFRGSGKAVISYTQTPTLAGYYLASVSDKIYMAPYGNGMIFGLGSNMIYFKDLLDELGINVQLIRHGKYKSAGEPFIKSEMSSENRKQNEEMLNALWGVLAESIAQSRGITIEELDRMLNNLELGEASDFVRYGLVDGIAQKDEMTDKLCSLYGVSNEDELSFIHLEDYSRSVVPSKSKNKIAVIYANGEIVEGSDYNNIGGDSFSEELAKIRKDTTLKTIVLRVNSPGGSVTAAEKVKRELDLMREQGRTIIASYGSYAASGGYWISAECDKIISNSTTLTGSIGVFSMIPDLGGAAKKIAHLNIHSVKTHDHADMLSLMRSFDPEELAFMQASVDTIYERFVGLVAQGRGLDKEYVDEIAQGRVWAGCEGRKVGLVDMEGGLIDAIEFAANAAGYDNYQIVEYPKPKTQMEILMEQLGMISVSKGSQFEAAYSHLKDYAGKVYARIPYNYEITY